MMLTPINRTLFALIFGYGDISCGELQSIVGHSIDVKKRLFYYRSTGLIEAMPKCRGENVRYCLTDKGRAELQPEDERAPLEVVPPRTWAPPPILTATEVPKMVSCREGADRAQKIRSLGAF